MFRYLRESSAQNPSAQSKAIVFAEIDERFLQPSMVDVSSSAEAIFRSEKIALALYSKMTRAQIEMVQQRLHIRAPFICESGAAIVVPDGYFSLEVPCDRDRSGYRVIEFGCPYADVVFRLHRAAERVKTAILGFSDQTVEQVAEATGLSLSHARLAKLREYDEPFWMLHPTRGSYKRLWRSLRAAGLACTSFGSPQHVGAPVNKGAAMDTLASLYRREFTDVITVVLGGLVCDEMPLAADDLSTSEGRPDVHAAADWSRHIESGLWVEQIVNVCQRARDHRVFSSDLGRE